MNYPTDLTTPPGAIEPSLLPPPRPLPPRVVQVMVAIALSLLAALLYHFWEWMPATVRIVLTLGAGIVTQFSALLAWQDPSRRKLGQALFPVSALLIGGGLLAVCQLIEPQVKWQTLSAFAAPPVALMMWWLTRTTRDAVARHVALLASYLAALAVLDALGTHPIITLMALGISMLAASWQQGRALALWQVFGGVLFLGGILLYAHSYDSWQPACPPIMLLACAHALWFRQPGWLVAAGAAFMFACARCVLSVLMGTSLWPLALVLVVLMCAAIGALIMRAWQMTAHP